MIHAKNHVPVDFNLDNFIKGLENSPNLRWAEIERAVLFYAQFGDAFYRKAKKMAVQP